MSTHQLMQQGVLEYYCIKFNIETSWDGELEYTFRIIDNITKNCAKTIVFVGTIQQAEDKFEELKTRFIFDREGLLSC